MYKIFSLIKPRLYKTLFMPNSTEKEISTALKTKTVFLSNSEFIMLINVKMLTIVVILTLISMICINMIHIMLSKGEHTKICITEKTDLVNQEMTTMNKYRVSIFHNFTNCQLLIMFLTIILALLNTYKTS